MSVRYTDNETGNYGDYAEAYDIPETNSGIGNGELQKALELERSTTLEMELEKDISSIVKQATEPPERTKLKRELEREALARLEEAARTTDDFQNVTAIWNRLDSNRERKERYHEVGRSTVPLEYGASINDIIIPAPSSNIFWKQVAKGDFLDAIFNCPFEMHELVEDIDISMSIAKLGDDHKEILYYLAVRQYSCQKVACIRGQTDRNVRKVRDTVLKKLRKQLLTALMTRFNSGDVLSFKERNFLLDYKDLLESVQ